MNATILQLCRPPVPLARLALNFDVPHEGTWATVIEWLAPGDVADFPGPVHQMQSGAWIGVRLVDCGGMYAEPLPYVPEPTR
jgi:hypothetical protein